MAELPKSVREQLARARKRPGSHPDADVLTAFSEDSLTPAERRHVSEHLASCAECREVLFLAQPEPKQVSTVVKALPARRFGWMAWASVAAVIVVVGSAVIIQREKLKTVEPPRVTATTTASAEDKTKPIVQPERAPAAPAERSLPAKVQVPTHTREESLAKAIPSPLVVEPLKEASSDQKKTKDEVQQTAGLVTNEAAQNAPAQIVAGRISSGPANTQNANVANVYTAQNTAPAAAPAMKTAQRRADAERDAASAASTFGFSQGGAVRRELGRAHWRISKAGAIERAYLADDWKPVLVGPGVSFRVISVIGDVVWAGGTHGALFVSRDSGTNWAPVKIDTSADITSIHFDESTNGTVQTSDGKSWKTSDGGTTWVMQ